jgi:hypothetical protein
MKTVAGRTYELTHAEFPLAITIVRTNTTGNAATTVIVGHVREMRNGVEIAERDVQIDNAQGIVTYRIDAPVSAGAVTMVQTLLGFFATAEGDTARFDVTIETPAGARARTSIRRPTFNPGTATLKFQVT